MSDMAIDRITIRVPATLGSRIRNRSRAKGQSPSELVRTAVETYLEQDHVPRTAYEFAKELGVLGAAPGLPKDLSTSKRHFDGFGKGRRK